MSDHRLIFGNDQIGSIGYSDWQSYSWKNELEVQKERIIQHVDELLLDAPTEYNSYHMLERAIGISAICMRRLVECRLLTDRFIETNLEIHEICIKPNHQTIKTSTPRFVRSSGGAFEQYNLQERKRVTHTPKWIADKFLHARMQPSTMFTQAT